MDTWREVVVSALEKLGGQGSLDEIYSHVQISTNRAMPPTWKAIIRRELEYNSRDSKSYKHRFDLFYSVSGIGNGIWGLRSSLASTPHAIDCISPPPERVITEVYRILRDTELARRLKKFYDNKCQLCGSSIAIADGVSYSEAHHIRPLGAPHNGPDEAQNIIVLCPNHHAACDYGAIGLHRTSIRCKPGHIVSQKHLDYHNQHAAARRGDKR